MAFSPMLEVVDLVAGYGRAQVLHAVGLSVAAGEVLVLFGRNGAGKSTTLKAMMGLLRPWSGQVRLEGRDLAGLPPHRIARAGLGYVPEERRLFATLTVAENLAVARRPPRPGLAPWTPERLCALFPNLVPALHRPAGRMSGGEQQMLAIARTLMGNPRLILLDEPSEGLAPLVVAAMAGAVRALKAEGVAVVLAEQNLAFARAVADRVATLESGRVTATGDARLLGTP